MTELNIMVGVPGSGKSYYVLDHCNKARDRVVSRDHIRFSMISDTDSYFSKENKVFREFCNQINEGLSYNNSIVWADATHLSKASRWKLLKNIEWYKFERINFICIEKPLEICLAQNANRTGLACVPESAIRRMFNQYQRPNPEDFKSLGNLGNIIVIGEQDDLDLVRFTLLP